MAAIIAVKTQLESAWTFSNWLTYSKRSKWHDAEAGIGPLLQPCQDRRKQRHHAEELDPRKLHPEPDGEAEVGNA
jgi:hypothetical protein